MTIVVTGSVATDQLMTFAARFEDQLLPDQLADISLSFLVEDMHLRRGGVAANICFGLAQLGRNPVLVAGVGDDFDDYDRWLRSHGVNTGHLLRCPDLHTARFICTTDTAQNQIASFYPGAMNRAATIDLAEVIRAVGVPARGDLAGGVELVVISPDAPDAMLRHTRACRALGIPVAADPSQQIARLDGPPLRELVEGARYLFTNAYESALLLSKTGWDAPALLERVGTWVTTRSGEGITIGTAGVTPVQVEVVPAAAPVDPTGVGDAFRAGFLAGVTAGLEVEHAAMAGAVLATTVLETTGTQEYVLDPERTAERLAATYGRDAAAVISAALPLNHRY